MAESHDISKFNILKKKPTDFKVTITTKEVIGEFGSEINKCLIIIINLAIFKFKNLS